MDLMGVMPYLHFSAFLIYLYLIIVILSKNIRAALNWVCSLMFGCLAIWSLCFIFVHNRETPENIARIFFNISSFGWLGLPYFVLWFVCIFTGKQYLLRKRTAYPFIILPPVILIYQQWSGNLVVEFVPRYFGWGTIWPDNIWFYVCSGYTLALGFLNLYLIENYRRYTEKAIEKKKAFIFFLCSLIPFVIGFITDVILPGAGIVDFPDTGDIVGLAWAIGIVYFIIRYKIFTLTPKLVAEDIIETMADSLVLVSPEKNIILANRATSELLGYSREELMNVRVNMIFDEKNGDAPFEGEDFKELLSKGYIQSYNVSYRTKYGETIPVNFSGSAVNDKNDALAGIVFIARDMRDIVKLIEKEKELAVADASARTGRVRTEEIEKAYKKLKDTQDMLVQSEKLRELGEIGAGVVHELNNPLTGIISLMRVYKKRQHPGTKEYEDLDEMEKGCKFMSGIIRGLGDFTRESSGKFVKLNCNVIVDSILSFLAMQLESKNIRIIRDYDEDIPYVYGNRHQLQQIVINMINNAKDALSGKGFLAVRTRSIEDNDGDFVEIEFEDSGCGIGNDIIDKIFDPFFTTKMTGQGVGLGLSVVHSIIKAHKGKISVESEKGKGSIFRISLPVFDENSNKVNSKDYQHF